MEQSSISFHIGHSEIVLRRRYEVLSIVNDMLVALWFIVGSILFFHESTTTLGTWLFLGGSIELMIRPLIRLSRHLHIGRVQGSSGLDSAGDY
ncbi:MAG: YrhK family protein [Nocardioidaceae bacterium]